jgi:hypothetical protein
MSVDAKQEGKVARAGTVSQGGMIRTCDSYGSFSMDFHIGRRF